MRKVLEFGGYAAAVILVGFGIASLVVSIVGRSEVQDNLAREQIEGTPDMTPEGIQEGAEAAGIERVRSPDLQRRG